MKFKGILLDLDQTLINSQKALSLRKQRKWREVYQIIPQLKPYPNVTSLLKYLNRQSIPICVVTSSPRTYCERVINYWDWNITTIVCYHDTDRHKPYPDPIIKGYKDINLSPNEVASVGDSLKDIKAAKAANVFSIGALWGSLEPTFIRESNPDLICEIPNELINFIKNNLI